MKVFTKALPFLLLFSLSLPAIRDLLRPGAYTSHDLTHHIVRIIQMDKILKEGQIPPRWAGELNYGYGYPVFLFNYPLPYLFGTFFHFLGFDFIWSAKLVFLSSMILSSLTAFIFFKELWQDKLSGFLASLFYLYAPIRFVNVYVSATIGNALAFTFIPLIFWAILRLKEKRSFLVPILIGSLNFAFLILSHNIIALMFAPLILGFAALIFLKVKTPRRNVRASSYEAALPSLRSGGGRPRLRRERLAAGVVKELGFLKKVFLFISLGLGLACFFWLPALIEKRFIRYDKILPDFYKTYFPSLWQLIHSPWGYGFDHPGTENDAMSFQIGLTHILVVVLTSLTFVFYLLNLKNLLRKRLSFLGKILKEIHQSISRDLKMAFFFLLFFILSVFLMQRVSIPVYEKIHYLQYVQHPWRFLALSVFCAASLSGYLVKILPGFWKILCFLILLFLVFYANRNHLRINQVFNPGEEYYFNIKGTTSMAGEHLPDWARQMDKEAERKIEAISGQATIEEKVVLSSKIEAKVDIKKRAVLKINHFYFPGWRLFVNGKEKGFNYLIKGPDKEGLPIFTLEKGDYHLKYILQRTSIRKFADLISLFSLIIWLSLSLRILVRRKFFNHEKA